MSFDAWTNPMEGLTVEELIARIAGAEDEATTLWEACREAKQAAHAAEACVARLDLARLAVEHPWIESFGYVTSYDYDDEGSYHHSATITIVEDEEAMPEDAACPDDDDAFWRYSPEVLAIVFGADEDSARLTREEVLKAV